MGEFKQNVKGGKNRKEKGGWQISKDREGHKGSEWRVFNPKQKRVASIRGNGEVVGK